MAFEVHGTYWQGIQIYTCLLLPVPVPCFQYPSLHSLIFSSVLPAGWLSLPALHWFAATLPAGSLTRTQIFQAFLFFHVILHLIVLILPAALRVLLPAVEFLPKVLSILFLIEQH